MHVAVGSANPVKVGAVETLVAERTDQVESVSVDSGVSEQPRGIDETITGAKNRARRAVSKSGADVGVGVEGGVTDYTRLDGLWLIMWAAVSDGGTTHVGGGPTIRLPEPIADRVRTGQELGPVMADVTGDAEIARGRGAAGVLTGGLTDRETALQQAIAGAFGPFLTDRFE